MFVCTNPAQSRESANRVPWGPGRDAGGAQGDQWAKVLITGFMSSIRG